jgi:phosphonate transport system substrate-binding protein
LTKKYYLVLICLLIVGALGCSRNDDVKKISLSKKIDVKNNEQQSEESPIRIAVGGMTTPREGFVYYKQLLNYIGEKLGRKVEFIDREDYAAINNMLKNREIDVAFVCGGPYVDGYEEFGLELLAAPVAYGETVYYSYIIVPKNSSVKSFKELRGKTFAFTDPLSNSGKLIPTYMLTQMNETPDSFFKSFYYSHAHDKSIKAVAAGAVDGAAVDSLIWEYENHTNPKFTSKTKIIEKSPPHGIPPVVIRHGIDLELKERLRQIFLNVHNDAKGREILKGMMIEKFVPIDNKAYNSIREMKQWVDKQEKKE